MIDAIINIFTDNHIRLGVFKFLVRLVNYKKLLKMAREISDSDAVEHVKKLFKASLSESEIRMMQRRGNTLFLLLVKCPNSTKWEVTAIDVKYKYVTKNVINANFLESANGDSYYIKLHEFEIGY